MKQNAVNAVDTAHCSKLKTQLLISPPEQWQNSTANVIHRINLSNNDKSTNMRYKMEMKSCKMSISMSMLQAINIFALSYYWTPRLLCRRRSHMERPTGRYHLSTISAHLQKQESCAIAKTTARCALYK